MTRMLCNHSSRPVLTFEQRSLVATPPYPISLDHNIGDRLVARNFGGRIACRMTAYVAWGYIIYTIGPDLALSTPSHVLINNTLDGLYPHVHFHAAGLPYLRSGCAEANHARHPRTGMHLYLAKISPLLCRNPAYQRPGRLAQCCVNAEFAARNQRQVPSEPLCTPYC